MKRIILLGLVTLFPAFFVGLWAYNYLGGYFHPKNSAYLGSAFVMIGMPAFAAITFLVWVFISQMKSKDAGK